MTERWLPVVGAEGFYEVSDLGRVRSLPRRTPHAGVRGGKVLTAGRDGHGYPKVVLSVRGRRRDAWIHKLVLEAFVGPCPSGLEARHGPGGKTDARLVNLCYGTHAQNLADRLRDGTANGGERNGHAKLTAAQVRAIRRQRAAGVPGRTLAGHYGVHEATISLIVSRKNWARLPD